MPIPANAVARRFDSWWTSPKVHWAAPSTRNGASARRSACSCSTPITDSGSPGPSATRLLTSRHHDEYRRCLFVYHRAQKLNTPTLASIPSMVLSIPAHARQAFPQMHRRAGLKPRRPSILRKMFTDRCGWREGRRQRGIAVDLAQRGVPLRASQIHLQIRQPAQRDLEHLLELHPTEVRTEAAMRTEPECLVPVGPPIDVHVVRVVERIRVLVGRRPRQEQSVTGTELLAAQYGLGGHGPGERRCRRRPPQEFLGCAL